jgi:hypothetical protein
MANTNQFPNGFQSWTEAHYEVTAAITRAVESGNYGKAIAETIETEGFVGLRDLAVDLANEFERENEGREWDGNFLESIWDFMGEKLA